MQKIQQSGLLQEVEELRYVILGDENKDTENCLVRYGEKTISHILKENVQKAWNIMKSYPNTRCIAIDREVGQYERATLYRLREDCRYIPDAHILYIHSKGVSRNLEQYPGVNAWTDAMLDGVITYRHLCWKNLAHHSAVGSFYYHEPNIPPHFSGNFWWSKSSHIASLGAIGDCFWDPEMWIIGNQPHVKWVCIREKNNDLYHHPMSLKHYRSEIVLESNQPRRGPPPTLLKEEIAFIDIGLENQWMACKIPFSGKFPLLIETLHFSLAEDVKLGLSGIKKIVRVHMKSSAVEYFLEGDVVRIV
jgi:hypothetical protein